MDIDIEPLKNSQREDIFNQIAARVPLQLATYLHNSKKTMNQKKSPWYMPPRGDEEDKGLFADLTGICSFAIVCILPWIIAGELSLLEQIVVGAGCLSLLMLQLCIWFHYTPNADEF